MTWGMKRISEHTCSDSRAMGCKNQMGKSLNDVTRRTFPTCHKVLKQNYNTAMPSSRIATEIIEKLIDLVRGHPSLYDSFDLEHRDVQRTQNMHIYSTAINNLNIKLFHLQQHTALQDRQIRQGSK